MDRAAKVRKYRRKTYKRRNRAAKPAGPLFSLFALGLLLAAAFAAFAVVFLNKNAGAKPEYVTQDEMASLMSFYEDQTYIKKWGENPGAAVTQRKMKELIQGIGLAGIVPVTGKSGKLSRQTVMDLYGQILDYLDLGEKVSKKTILLLSQSGKSCQTKDGAFELDADSLELKPFHTYEAYAMGQSLLGIPVESNKTLALKDVLADAVTKRKVSFWYGDKKYQIPCKSSNGLQGQDLCTLCIKGGKVTKVKDIRAGDASVQEKKQESAKASGTVKVLLLNKGDVHYDQLYVACNGNYCVKKDKKKKTYKKSDVLNIKKLKVAKGGYITAAPVKPGDRLFLADQQGNLLTKGYYGSFIVYRDAEGYYIVNKVEVEKYLYSVVASEMPASFGAEALKAQAVCARTYVYQKMQQGNYGAYHAQIDDSVNCQVYNKSEIAEDDVTAVDGTAGMVMYAADEIVNAYYFSSSCGYTSGMEVWNQKGACPYLKAKSLIPSEKKFDLSDEDTFRKFITSSEKAAYDSHSIYYRWLAKVELSAHVKELKQKIESARQANPANVTYYRMSGKKQKEVSSLKGFGGAKKMYCLRRAKSGSILELAIGFEFGTVKVRSEYNIRSIIGCALEKITYADGSSNTSLSFLPSASFSIKFDKASRRFLLTGGGNGHGMGMSQYGASAMAKSGWDYKKILKFFYDGITIRKISP